MITVFYFFLNNLFIKLINYFKLRNFTFFKTELIFLINKLTNMNNSLNQELDEEIKIILYREGILLINEIIGNLFIYVYIYFFFRQRIIFYSLCWIFKKN